MRSPMLLAPVLLLAACGGSGNTASAAGNGADGNQAEPVPSRTGPPPLTPRLNVPPQGNEAGEWLGPRAPSSAPPTAPYGNLLDQPVVNGSNP